MVISVSKNAQFDANCIKFGFLVLRIFRFYVFKMAANFETNTSDENYQLNLFLIKTCILIQRTSMLKARVFPNYKNMIRIN